MLNHFIAQIPATTNPVSTVDDVLAPYVYVFYAAFLVSYAFTPIMRQVALYYGIIDRPDLIRKLHRFPVAYLGGIAVFLGWVAGLAISQFLTVHRIDSGLAHLQIPIAVVCGAAIIVALGLWDDIRKAPPWLKITFQITAAIILLLGGIGTHCMEPLLSPILVRLHKFYSWDPVYDQVLGIALSIPVAIIIVVGCCNATNLMDGMDGLCGGVTGIITFGLVFLAVHMATAGGMAETNVDGMRIVLGLALLGAILGFVPYNFNPASIFLGDTGSMFIGFSCATIMIMMAENRTKWFLGAMVMFALPVLDTSLAMARRWVNRRPIFSPDRHHFHHQLVARGFTVKQTVVICYFMAMAFVALGAALVFMRARYAGAIYLVIFGSIIVAAYKVGMVHETTLAVTPKRLGSDSSITPKGAPEQEDVLEVRSPNGDSDQTVQTAGQHRVS